MVYSRGMIEIMLSLFLLFNHQTCLEDLCGVPVLRPSLEIYRMGEPIARLISGSLALSKHKGNGAGARHA